MGLGEVTPEGVTDNAPLPLLMTRPLAAAKAFVAGLPSDVLAQVQPLYAPLIEPSPLDVTVDLSGINGVIFTSANGVSHAPKGAGQPAYCVGRATTEAARVAGWEAVFAGKDAEELVAQLSAHPPTAPLLHLSGRHTRGKIAQRLTDQGIPTEAIAIYNSVLQPLTEEAHTALSGATCVIIPLFSPRTAAHLCAQASGLGRHAVITLSAAVAEALPKAQREKIRVASEPTAEAMRKAVVECVKARRMG